MKNIPVYDLNEIVAIFNSNFYHYEPDDVFRNYISDALFEWSAYERFIHLSIDKLEHIATEYREDGYRVSVDKNKIPDKVQKWIDIVNELIFLIENKDLPDEFIVDYESDLNVYK